MGDTSNFVHYKAGLELIFKCIYSTCLGGEIKLCERNWIAHSRFLVKNMLLAENN